MIAHKQAETDRAVTAPGAMGISPGNFILEIELSSAPASLLTDAETD
jgi:hypothetical protein